MRVIGLLVLAAGVLATPAIGAGQPAPEAAPDEPVPVYTNADLERFGPSDAPAGPVTTPDEGDWEFVQAFLDREYARVDTERDYELLRAAAAERAWLLENPRPRYVAPYRGVYGSSWVMPWRYPHAGGWHSHSPYSSHPGAGYRGSLPVPTVPRRHHSITRP
jgi:hypothetical protein